ncbi:MAG: ATP-binding protein [Bacteriovoracia bacterium]
MKAFLLTLIVLLSDEAHCMEWRFRTFETINDEIESEWKPANKTKNLIQREFQGYIEYETSFKTDNANQELAIFLGKIGDTDKVYVNDVLIGQTGDFPPNYSYNMDVERLYFIPQSLLRHDKKNELKVTAYSKYFVNKGLDINKVEIGNPSRLQQKKYLNEILNNFSMLIIPLLCLILAAISFPLLAPRELWLDQTVIFFVAISSFVFSFCRGRVGFHFIDMLLMYKTTLISGIVSISLISIYSIGLKTKYQKLTASVLVGCASILTCLFLVEDDLMKAAEIAKVWFHIAPVFILIAFLFVYWNENKSLPLKVGLFILLITDLNDILNDLKIIKSVSLLQSGLGIFILFLILNQIAKLRKSWEKYFKKEFELETDARLGRQALQLAHDIRSPLEALKSAKDEIARLPELERTSINLAIGRIEEIAYKLLLMRKKIVFNSVRQTHVKSTLGQIIQEKKMQYRTCPNLTINFTSSQSCFSVFSSLESETFKRIISNLLDNAIEAINFNGKVKLLLSSNSQSFEIEVLDSGPKISSELLSKIFEKGFTTKKEGNGLGLYHAKKEIEAAQGTISFIQKEMTSVKITLPLGEVPNTFVTTIDVKNIKRVIILDDDESIHQIWKKRFKNINVELEHFYNSCNLLNVYNEIPEDCFLLSDFELLGEKVNGIDCILKLGATKNSILVTARADESQIIRLCSQHGIKVLPKSMANEIDIKTQSYSKSKFILIDDDKMTHFSWKLAAKKAEVDFEAFTSVQDFIKTCSFYEHSTPIYIDSDLGKGLKGEVLSEEIYNLGFTQLYLATGYSASDINKPSWIKEVLGKSPPFLN